MIDRHHLLECILWPNGDGTFRKIINPYKRLQKLGIYDERKLTIPIEHGAHSSMHRSFRKGTEYEVKLYGDRNPRYGKGYLQEGDKNPSWKGDKVGPMGLYKRAKILYKSGQMTEEEFQPFRDTVTEYQRLRRKKRKYSTLP